MVVWLADNKYRLIMLLMPKEFSTVHSASNLEQI